MADLSPDYLVSQQKLKFEIMQLEARIEGRKLELLELVSKRNQTLSNWASEKEAIKQKKETLKALAEAHGAVTEEIIEESKTTQLVQEPEEN